MKLDSNTKDINWDEIQAERDKLPNKLRRFIYGKIDFFRYDLPEGLKNYWKFRKVIFRDRWWDYSFLDEIILFKLKDMEKHWGKDTHYLGDGFTKGRLRVLIRRLEKLEEDIDDSMMSSLNKKLTKQQMERNYHKQLDSFYKVLGRNIRKFWD